MADAEAAGVRNGYAKSAATQAAILAAALAEFGDHGFATATTRRIAARAGVALPAIAYHFGDKQGLYLACAHAIVARYQAAAGALAGRAMALLGDEAASADGYRALLADTLKMVLRLFLDEADGGAHADFATRELRDQGPAFDILHDQLWKPGVEATARLVAGVRGLRAATPADRIDALMLISSLLAFATGRDVSLRILGLEGSGHAALGIIEQAIDASVARL